MNTIKVNHGNIKMVAHRGLSGIERENTTAAFIAAGNRSYYGIETDVHQCADGELVVIHDEATGRVADGNIVVEESTFAQLQQLNILDITGCGAAPRLDLKIPTLADYADICQKYEKVAVLELKPLFTEDALKKIISTMEKAGVLENTVFISFHWENMVMMRKLLPKQPLQFLTSHPCTPELIEQLDEHRLDLDIRHTQVTKELVDELHRRGLVINAWTCDTVEDFERLAECGVDFVTSNILE